MKKAEFLRIAGLIHRDFGVTALLYGSLGLEQRLQLALNPDDIDILIPEEVLYDRWAQLIRLMQREGYALYDEEEHAFEKNGLSVAFASLENLESFAGVEVDAIPVMEEAGVCYRLLDLEDYMKVYTASSKDGYRKNVKNKQDQAKIDLIRKAIQEG